MKKLVLLFIAIIFSFTGFAAYLVNVPVELQQPDGTKLACFITGDEFHRRLHDERNYTIFKNKITGFFVYALIKENKLIASDYVVGIEDPVNLPIEPGYDIPVSQMERKREEALKSAQKVSENSTTGIFNNLVISIRFHDQGQTNLSLENYENKFNSETGVSLKYYFKEVSDIN